MVKYICDCCGKELPLGTSLKCVEVLTGVPCKQVGAEVLKATKDLCTECETQYREAIDLATYKAWSDLLRDKAWKAWEGMKHGRV